MFEIYIICGAFWCPYCQCLNDTYDNRRLNTQYVDDDLNYFMSCEECYIAAENYYAELWQMYYQGIL